MTCANKEPLTKSLAIWWLDGSTINSAKILQSVPNKNPLTIIHDRIIQDAKRLFIHTNEKGKTIAYEPGLENEAYFSKFYKVNRFQSGRIHKKSVLQNP
jgi:hypothetical protein